MKRSSFLVATAVTLGACRAVLGIEDQSVANVETRDAGRSDAASFDAHSEADASEAGTKPAPVAACVGKTGGDCQKCCRDLTPPGNMAFDQALSANCLCQGEALCKSACLADLCAGGTPGTPGSACLNCVTQYTTDPACDDAMTACRSNPGCAPIADCIQGTCE